MSTCYEPGAVRMTYKKVRNMPFKLPIICLKDLLNTAALLYCGAAVAVRGAAIEKARGAAIEKFVF